jgi:hypothetical protein
MATDVVQRLTAEINLIVTASFQTRHRAVAPPCLSSRGNRSQASIVTWPSARDRTGAALIDLRDQDHGELRIRNIVPL